MNQEVHHHTHKSRACSQGDATPLREEAVRTAAEPKSREAEQLERLVARHGFRPYDYRFDGYAHIYFVETIEEPGEAFEALRLALKEAQGRRYNPVLRDTGGELALVLMPHPRLDPRSRRVNFYLLLATIFTTTWAGTIFWGGYSDEYEFESGWDLLLVLVHPRLVFMGWLTFSLPLMTILGCHEMGHYWMARRYNLDASLPFFIPLPPPLILGTMGAFISIREPIPNRRALLDVGISGPIAGLVAAIPVTLLGFWLTERTAMVAAVDPGDLMYLGEPLLFRGLAWFAEQMMTMHGGYLIHPVAFAGWVGFLVTALNLLPAGQLDGGHIARALLGPRARHLSHGIIAMMLFLAFFGLPGHYAPYLGWAIFAMLVYFLGTVHPPPSEDLTPLDGRRKALGVVAALMLVGCFIPSPIEIGETVFGLELESADRDFTNVPDGDNLTSVWINNTGRSDGWDNLTLRLVLPTGWNGSFSVDTVHDRTATWNASHGNFSTLVHQPDPRNATLNLTAGAGANLTVRLEIPADAAPQRYTPRLLVTSRTEKEHALRFGVTVVPWELEVTTTPLIGAAGENLTADVTLNNTGAAAQDVRLVLVLDIDWGGGLNSTGSMLRTLRLESGVPAEVTLTVRAPADATPGDHALLLRVTDGRGLQREYRLTVTLEAP